jgi:hypothetical protein
MVTPSGSIYLHRSVYRKTLSPCMARLWQWPELQRGEGGGLVEDSSFGVHGGGRQT